MDSAASPLSVERLVAASGEANRRVIEELLKQLGNPNGLEWAGFYREIAEAAARDNGKWQALQQEYYAARQGGTTKVHPPLHRLRPTAASLRQNGSRTPCSTMCASPTSSRPTGC